jgi:uncharacterized protein (TIGR02996 family)
MTTLTTDDDFVRTITENPEDDAVRLIYADFLEEHGQPERAEFIRVQCALARGGNGPRRIELMERERLLLERHGLAWAGPLRRLVRDWEFRRGFIDKVSVEARAFVTRADELFRLAPLQRVGLYWGAVPPQDRARFVPVLAECGHLRRLRGLDLTHNYLGSSGVQALAVCDYLDRLTDLNLSYNHIGDAGVRALAASALPERLHTLNLAQNDLGPGAVRTLSATLQELAGRTEELPLHSLDLRGNRLGVAGQREVMNCPVLRRIVRL